MWAGVVKSGSPDASDNKTRPDARRRRARSSTAIVADSCTAATRSDSGLVTPGGPRQAIANPLSRRRALAGDRGLCPFGKRGQPLDLVRRWLLPCAVATDGRHAD